MLIANIDHSLEDLPMGQGLWEWFAGIASLDTCGNTGFQDPTEPNMHAIEERFDKEAITVEATHQDILQQEQAPARYIVRYGLVRALLWDSETGKGILGQAGIAVQHALASMV
jgi:hypothetical protein